RGQEKNNQNRKSKTFCFLHLFRTCYLDILHNVKAVARLRASASGVATSDWLWLFNQTAPFSNTFLQ
ncbi:hypothetical protein, partial [Oceanipulchritudo coccoides]|uniref:hypothetical protein n=1 Tax=Oceanipulchritudo coccoides TaxID=2706888 RepID=UPI001EE7AC1B